MAGRVLVKFLCMAAGTVGLFWLMPREAAGDVLISPSERTRTIRPLEKKERVVQDFVQFTNGDMLSGEIQQIDNGIVTMKPDMGEEKLTIPVGRLKEVVFKDAEEETSSGLDRLTLVNRESLSGKIDGMTEKAVTLRLPSSQILDVDRGDAAGIAFYREGEVLGEESFDSGLPEGMSFKEGEWRARRGWLLQTDSRGTNSLACLPATQTGDLVYEWSVNTTVGRSTGFYFLASDPERHQGAAYFVRILRKYVYIYFCMNGEEVYCGSRPLSLYRSKNEVRLRCDAEKGLIEISVDGKEAGRWESWVPIRTGRYVILRADGRAAFGGLKVVRKGGAAHPELKENEGEGHVLKLVNGDVITGKVTRVSEKSVFYTGYEGGDTGRVSKDRLLWLQFDKKLKPLPRGVQGRVVFLLRDGDRVSGELTGVDGELVRMRSELLGSLDLRRQDVEKIVLKEFP